MTQQFKFGDRVRVLKKSVYNQEIGVVTKISNTPKPRYRVAFENDLDLTFSESELELVLHPDTERLDWIEEEDIAVTPLSIPSIAGDYDVGWELSSEYTNGDTFIYDMPHKLEPSLRECIDVAMQQEQYK